MKITRPILILQCYFMIPLVGCTLSTTRSKDPVITDINGLKKEIATLVSAENINLAGKETTTNNKTTSELEISITNVQNIPKDDDLIRTLCRLIAKRVKTYLKDSLEFNSYAVLFVTIVEDGSLTKRKWTGYKFELRELTAPFFNIGKTLTPNELFVYGGSTFTNEDSEVICVLRDFTFIDTSSVFIKVFKEFKNNHEVIGEKHIEVKPYANYLCQRINVKPLYIAHGTGKYVMAILSHDITIATQGFELK